MSAEKGNQIEGSGACFNLESVNRISKFPVVEATLQTGKTVYERVKDYNSVTNWTISTAESTVYKAVEVGKPYVTPVVISLDGHIKKVDGLICSGLDYVEAKIPSVKLPPGEMLFQMYNNTKDYINNSPTVQTACALAQPAVQTAKNIVEPAVETAKNTVIGAKNMVESEYENVKQRVEPHVQTARSMVEPIVQSSMDRANAIREYGTQKIEEYLNTNAPAEEESDDDEDVLSKSVECVDCQDQVKH